MTYRSPLLALLVVVGCNNNKTPEPTAKPDAAAPVASAPVVVPDAGPALPEGERVVRAWSEALDKHDVAALEKLYGDNVFFYTAKYPRAKVVAAKKSVLGPNSTFHQKIMGAIELSDDGHKATFTKQSGNGTKLGESKAIIVLAGSPLVIVEERDAPRDAASCEDVASSVAWNIPKVKTTMDGVRRSLEKFPDRSEGGIGPETFDDGSIQASIGVHQPDRFERIASYTAYKSGRLDVNCGGEDFTTDSSGLTFDGMRATKLSKSDATKVMAACGPPAEH